ncbi:zinc finger matrin-type protein 1 [Synchiropus splendidus]|uniref:zinc finger matrin-type protein 1 n=1 Tax=Synchiropus splendidus TaxID=270530 RepID=UPI00237D8EC0|nr:zinc finger matrin-type protein 1 [Synchiropus splendidus]
MLKLKTPHKPCGGTTQHPDQFCTDDYCYLCSAGLQFESQRQSHYGGKKHAQKLKLHLHNKAAATSNGPQQTTMTDKDQFCQLCNMVFSSPVVAKSHYEGKVQSINLRKYNLGNSDSIGKVLPSVVAESSVDNSEGTEEPRSELDLKDPNNYCALCSASFNTPQMASQHYNRCKHQKNEARLKQLQDPQATIHVACKTCSLQFNPVERCQTHIQEIEHGSCEEDFKDMVREERVKQLEDKQRDGLVMRRERKKTKERVDTRTEEEERLWDDSILGC